MGSIVSLFAGPPATPDPVVPQVVASPVEEQDLGSDEERRKRAEERRRAMARLAGGALSTVRTTPLGATATTPVAKAGLSATDSIAPASSGAAAQPRKTTLG